MTSRFSFIVLLSILMIFTSWTFAQEAGKEETKTGEDKFEVSDPQSAKEAEELFGRAFGFQQEEKFDKALLCYEALLRYFEKDNTRDNNFYAMHVLNNQAVLKSNDGDHKAAIQLFQRALQYALKLDLNEEVAEFYHKLGILYTHQADLVKKRLAEKSDIFPTEERAPELKKLFTRGVYTRLTQEGEKFIAQRIRLKGSKDPFQKIRELYTKLINLKVRSDFDPSSLMVPDEVRLVVEVHKKGYHKFSQFQQLLPEIEYSEIMANMQAKPRKVEPRLTDDFFNQPAIPDEITLTYLVNGQVTGRPIRVSDKEEFKPGSYQLTIQKAGYETIRENLTIYPDEGPFELRRIIRSKMRPVVYAVRSEINIDGVDEVKPDEISLNGIAITENSRVKPSQDYRLVIKADGFEPIVRQGVVVEPDERQYRIEEFMKVLPRDVLFHITGDYRPDERLQPDEVTFDGRAVNAGGEQKLPGAYRMYIRKKGYQPVSERIVIRPKSEPYVVKRKLNALPRRIQLDLISSFPRERINFPDICTLNGKDINTAESFMPGEYTLYIKHRGYQAITKTIEINPDDEPYIISQTLEPKDVQMAMDISFDIDPQDPSLPYEVEVKNEVRGEVSYIKDGDKIRPSVYIVTVKRPGYEIDTQRVQVLPSDEKHLLERRLVASPRRVVTQISAEYPEGNSVDPDEITLNGQPITKDFRIKPGSYDLIIRKEGYLPLRETITILASDKDFLLVKKLITRPRLVNLEFRDSYDRRKLSPDEIYFNTDQIPSGETITLKPGEYTLRSKLKGYATLEESVTVPVGSEVYPIVKFMVAIKRDIVTSITGDYRPEAEIEPDVLTLNGTPIGKRGTITPGKFNLIIRHKGYFPIDEPLEIVPDPKPYSLRLQLTSKPRAMLISIKSSFSGEKMAPESIMVGTDNVKDGQEIKPGSYTLSIREKGYKTISESLEIPPSESPLTIDRTMEALPVMVKYRIANNFDSELVTPDVITLNDKIVDQRTSFLPGTYTLKIEKRGFHPKQSEIRIEPSDEDYIIEETLIAMEREIEAIITGDFPPDEPIDPEILALGNRDVRESVFAPGKYELVIENPGYEPTRKEVVIPPGEEPFLIEEVLITKPRKLKESITYDVMPPEEGDQPYEISIAPVDRPAAKRVVKDGDLIKPNSYILTITKKAYETIEVKKHVWPEEAPFEVDEQLIAKQVTVHISISHDVPPPPGLDEYTVSLIDKRTGALNLVTHGKKIKPGEYGLDIQRPGYSFGQTGSILILPSEEPYLITGSLLAMPRNLSFDMEDPKTRVLVPAHEIIDAKNQQPISFKDKFAAGSDIDIIVKFKKYATVRKVTKVVPGQGPLVVPVTLTKLLSYEFPVRKNSMKLDGIDYEYRFFSDNEEIEKHLISVERGVGRYYYTVWAPEQAKKLRALAGYLFAEKEFERVRFGLGTFNRISVKDLMTHLNKVSEGQRGRRASMEVMEKMLKTFAGKRKLGSCHPDELNQLINFVGGWTKDLPAAADRVRLKVVVEAIEGVKNK